MVRAFIEGLNFVLEAFIAVISPAMEIAGAFILKTWPFAGDFTGGGPNIYILSFVLGARGCLSICNLMLWLRHQLAWKSTQQLRWSDMSPGYLGGLMVEVPPPRKKPSTTTESQ